MKWYFYFNEAATGWFADMIKVMVVSARRCPTLEPNCLYDGEPSALTDWLTRQGVRVHHTRLPFYDRLFAPDILARNPKPDYDPVAASAHFLPLMIAEVELEAEYALCTDCDIAFLRPHDFGRYRPRTIAAAPEIRDTADPRPGDGSNGFNAGVMLFNVPILRARLPSLLRRAEAGAYFTFASGAHYDQGLLNEEFAGEWERLDKTLNWRPYFGTNYSAVIQHWHGPKPVNLAYRLGRPMREPPPTSPQIERLLDFNQEAYRRAYARFEADLRVADRD